jgi:diaminopimelate epimerase
MYLATHADVDISQPLPIATRAGLRTVTFDDGGLTVDMGTPTVVGETAVSVGERSWKGLNVDMGNPHAVVFVDDLGDAGSLLEAPGHDEATYPHGVNVEFLKRTGAGRVSMRVHERGSGETRSCGTGACAAMVATQLQDESPRGTPYEVDVPGGRLSFVWTDDDRVLMTGPAVLVAEGFVTVPE